MIWDFYRFPSTQTKTSVGRMTVRLCTKMDDGDDKDDYRNEIDDNDATNGWESLATQFIRIDRSCTALSSK